MSSAECELNLVTSSLYLVTDAWILDLDAVQLDEWLLWRRLGSDKLSRSNTDFLKQKQQLVRSSRRPDEPRDPSDNPAADGLSSDPETLENIDTPRPKVDAFSLLF